MTRLSKLPGWALSEEEGARAEAERWASMSAAELWREVEDCARDAMWAVRASPFPDRVLAYEEPLPESTIVALRRLRASRR